MPAFAGKTWYGEDIQRYKLITDTVMINDKAKVYVTITSKAFGFTIWESCEVKCVPKRVFNPLSVPTSCGFVMVSCRLLGFGNDWLIVR